MWDASAKVVKYLHCMVGVSEAQTRMRQSILSADVEMDEASVHIAMQQGVKEGLSANIPKYELGKFPHGEQAALSPAKPEKRKVDLEPEVTGQTPCIGIKLELKKENRD